MRSRASTARPAVSLPWIEPTTSTFTGPSPTRSARSGRSCAEWPNRSDAAAAARASTRGTVASGVAMDSIVIVGAGTFGASLAWWLAREGVQVTLVDQFEPGDRRATSGGETRLIRCGHGADAGYTASARRARTLWRELEAESGADLLIECGLVWFARRADGWEAASEATMRAQDIPVERLSADEGTRLFPSFRGDDLEFLLHEPEAGVLRAQRAIQTLAAQAQAHGARLVRGARSRAGRRSPSC